MSLHLDVLSIFYYPTPLIKNYHNNKFNKYTIQYIS